MYWSESGKAGRLEHDQKIRNQNERKDIGSGVDRTEANEGG